MTLADILTLDGAALRQHAIVFGDPLAVALGEKWTEYGSTLCVPTPRMLTDGRWMLCADILVETRPGGLLERMWSNSDQALIAAAVEVMPMADAVALLPETVEDD